ncbi:phage tail tape measure protein [Grimontia marina]|uniref:Phage-related minor tail protein n=1 Tax=Grimontia marina TaxID=646534 RepID=A0A128F8R8_9GAMM|nr:phage tail tape measure protein [Grimontia marina]CZF83213.1 Phage-related minor tail protein [Grimontia marina]
MSLPEPLRFTVGLIDQISQPLGNIQRQFSAMSKHYRDGTHTMVAGAAGVAGAGIALQQALQPAIDMDRALGEVKSLGVADAHLQHLADTALSFSVEYGKSAAEFVAASYDIQSSMEGINPSQLASITQVAAVTAAATKAQTSTITDYFGTMYGIFSDNAKAIGQDAWAEQLGSYTALAVQKFKTDGIKLSQSFKSLGNDATTAGVSLGEQFAVLGLLGNQMEGSVAATKYQAFIAKVAGAGEKLGLNFLDSNHQLKDTASIIQTLRQQYGSTLDAMEKLEIEKAFGGKQAMSFINTLYDRTGELKGAIDDFNQVKGLALAQQMAGAMTDQWERMEAGIFAIRAAIGSALLPSLLPLVQSLADGAMQLVQWTQVFPKITKWLGYAALGFFGLVAAGGVLTIITGAMKMLWATVMLVGTPLIKGLGLAFGALSKTLAFAKGAFLALNIVMAANPIVLIVGACVAAVAAMGALTYYWDDLKASFGDTAWFDAITLLSAPFRAAFQAIYGGWKWVTSGFTDVTAFEGLFAIGDELKAVFTRLFEWLNSGFNAAMESVKGLVDWIPGFGSDEEAPGQKIDAVRQATPRAPVQQGGVARQMATYNQGRSTHYGGVNIYAQQVNSPQDLAHELEMAAP